MRQNKKTNFNTFLWKDFCKKFMNYSRFSKAAPEADERVIKALNRILKPKFFMFTNQIELNMKEMQKIGLKNLQMFN